MTKGLMEGQWLANPCPFLTHPSKAALCSNCESSFSFWSKKRHCHFCGSVVHSSCTESVKSSGKSYKMCLKCWTYKNFYSLILSEGDEFVIYTDTIPSAAFLHLSEHKCSLSLKIDPSDAQKEILLSEIVCIQKGFSHAGHLRAGLTYDPMRCFSITTKSTTNGLHCYDLKACSPMHCQQWLTALNSTLELFNLLQEQDKAVTHHTSLGHSIPRKGHLYFPDKITTPDPHLKSASMSIISPLIEPKFDVYEQSDLVIVDIVDETSRGTLDTPINPQVVRQSHYKIRTLNTPKAPLLTSSTFSQKSEKFSQSTSSNQSNGLPYKGHKNPLASNCACHAYAIEPSNAFLYPLNKQSNHKSIDPFSLCCERCRGKCRIAHDLSTF